MSAQRLGSGRGVGRVLGLVRPTFVILLLALLPVAAVERIVEERRSGDSAWESCGCPEGVLGEREHADPGAACGEDPARG